MPPESPEDCPHLTPIGQPQFFRLLRSEFLQLLKRKGLPALSPDALTNWSRDQADAAVHNARVREATRFLITTVIPEFAAELDDAVAEAVKPQSPRAAVAPSPSTQHLETKRDVASSAEPASASLSLSLSGTALTRASSAPEAAGHHALSATVASSTTTGVPSGAPTLSRVASTASDADLPAAPISSARVTLSIPISEEIHKRGINVRHCGLLRSLVKRNEQARAVLLIEIVGAPRQRVS